MANYISCTGIHDPNQYLMLLKQFICALEMKLQNNLCPTGCLVQMYMQGLYSNCLPVYMLDGPSRFYDDRLLLLQLIQLKSSLQSAAQNCYI